MAYVSNALTHWVGRGKAPEDQYRILTQEILKKKELMFGACDWHFGSEFGGVKKGGLQLMMVSFADIPFSDCETHCAKYSRFGLSFEKHYLANCLTCPVGYVQHPLIHQNYSRIYHALRSLEGTSAEEVTIKAGLDQGQRFSAQSVMTRFQYMMCFLENYSSSEFRYHHKPRPEDEPLPGQEGFFEEPSALYYEREWRMMLSSGPNSAPWIVRRGESTYFRFREKYLKWVIVPRAFVSRLKAEQGAIFGEYQNASIPTVLAFEDLKYF